MSAAESETVVEDEGSLANFYDLSRGALDDRLSALGAPAYRSRQVWDWAYQHLVDDFDGMTNLPSAIRRPLALQYTLRPATIRDSTHDRSSDSTKVLLELGDGETVETVLMREPYGHTVCVSTQVGCPMGCLICATGQAGFRRNLTAGEIIYQVVQFARGLAPQGNRVTNVVFMGMGEPLLNYEATLAAIACLADPTGLAVSPHRITVSTVGLPERIVALAGQPCPVRLAVSLHGPDEETRARLVPASRSVPLDRLMAACATYARVRGTRITFEYAMVAGVNDSPAHARKLVSLIGSLPAHVNLIPMNPVPGCDWTASPPEVVEQFREPLTKARIPATVRLSRGVTIGAGCGQLRGGGERRPRRTDDRDRGPRPRGRDR